MMNTKKTKQTGNSRLPSLFGQTLVKSEYDYRREIRRKLDRIQHDNRDAIRRRLAQDHVFAHDHLAKRYQWFTSDKSYRDSCRSMWSRQSTESGRSSNLFLPSIFTPDAAASSLTMSSLTTHNTKRSNESVKMDEKIKHDFLEVQPVMLEIIRAPHASAVLKYKQEVAARRKSAEKRQAHIQTTAKNDDRYVHLMDSLQNV